MRYLPFAMADACELDIQHAADRLRSARRLAVLTGAGVSAESGLATFRGPDGLWEGQRPEEVATPFAFRRDPELVWRFYNHRRANLAKVEPNPGHHALAALEKRFGSQGFSLITQNVDGLHQAAGSQNVLEIHGSIRIVRCTGCGKSTDRGVEPLEELPRCQDCGELLRPAVVWFHEALPQDVWQKAEAAVGASDCLLVIGTSAVVYPAAGLIEVARSAGAAIIEFNLEPTAASQRVDLAIYGPSGQLLPRVVAALDADRFSG